jgi:hypothetical protein
VWLLPISTSEARWVQAHGAGAFEAAIAREKPDFLDLKRASMRPR